MTLNTWGFGEAQGRNIAGYVRAPTLRIKQLVFWKNLQGQQDLESFGLVREVFFW